MMSNNYYISISHSYKLVSVGISNSIIGIDIEKNRFNDILKIKKKFIHKSEDLYNGLSNESDYLHIIWGIKEGLFKLCYQNFWNFLLYYRVDYFKLKKYNLISCWIIDKKNIYYASYKKINDYFLICVLNYKFIL